MGSLPYELNREYWGIPPPPGTHIPTPAELLNSCTKVHELGQFYSMGVQYPSENYVFWVKYGYSVVWPEIPAQVTAYHELRRLGSSVKVPGIFYACQITTESRTRSYIVMEYIPGQTAGELLDSDPAAQESVGRKIGFALSELMRIPVAPGSRPAAIDNGMIRHPILDDAQASRHYQNVDQLEEHLNTFLELIKKKRRLKGLSLEPMIFCYGDVWHGNFIIDAEGNIAVVDFAETSILPSSFLRFVTWSAEKLKGLRVEKWVELDEPSAESVNNNALALADVSRGVVNAWPFIHKTGKRVPGSEWKPDNEITNLV